MTNELMSRFDTLGIPCKCNHTLPSKKILAIFEALMVFLHGIKCHLGKSIHHRKNRIHVYLSPRQPKNKIHANIFPWCMVHGACRTDNSMYNPTFVNPPPLCYLA